MFLHSPIDSKLCERLLLAIFLLTLPLINPWIRGDGIGYYAYARAPLIEHSLDFLHDYQLANDSFREARVDSNGLPREEFRTRTRHLDNHFTVGPAILWSPFLLTAHGGVLLARALGSTVKADGFSAPYRIAMALATALYGFLGLLLAFRLTQKFMGPLWAFLATVTIWWASSLPVYMYFNPSWSHAHSAFSVALFLWYWERTRENRTVKQWAILGAITGLMLNVYYANLMILGILVVEALFQFSDLRERVAPEATNFLSLLQRYLVFGGVVIACMLPTFLSRWIVYGGPFETGYLSIRDFLWASPVFLKVLFSSNHGLLSWTPVVLLSLVGLVLFVRQSLRIGLAFLAATLAFYLFISFYPDWAGISSYGNRFFISLTALFIFGLAVLLQSLSRRFSQQRTAVVVASLVLGCFALWNLGLIYQWGTHLIPARGPISFSQAASNQFRVVPVQISSQIRKYFFRREALMQQIERKDIEQMKEGSQP